MFRITLRGWPLWALLSVLGFCTIASTVHAIWPQRCETVSELRAQSAVTTATRVVRTAAPTRTDTTAIAVSSSGFRVPQYSIMPNDLFTDQTKSGTSREGNGQVRTGTILMFQ